MTNNYDKLFGNNGIGKWILEQDLDYGWTGANGNVSDLFSTVFGLSSEVENEKKTKREQQTVQGLFKALDDETLKTVYVTHGKTVEITYTEKPKYEFDVMNSDDNNIPSLVVYYLRNKSYSYLHTRYNSDNVYVINLKNIKYEEFPKSGAVSSDVSGSIIFHFKGNDFYFENKVENARRLQWVFKDVPELKTEYLRLVKNRRNFLENEIKKIENAPIFPLTDEDKLIIEVMDD